MSLRNQFLLRGMLLLAAGWIAVFGLLKWTGSMRASPEKVVAYIRERPLDGIEDPEERLAVIGETAEMLNQLEPGELRELEEQGGEENGRAFFESMTEEEQRFFLEKRLGRAFEQIMIAFNEMDREERQAIVERSLEEMRENGRVGPGPDLEEEDPEIVEKITEAGLRAYYQEASAETKLDLAPLMEEMQRSIERGGGFGGRARR